MTIGKRGTQQVGDQLARGWGEAYMDTGRQAPDGKSPGMIDASIHDSMKELGVRTPCPVGGGRWRIEAEELERVLELAVIAHRAEEWETEEPEFQAGDGVLEPVITPEMLRDTEPLDWDGLAELRELGEREREIQEPQQGELGFGELEK